MLVERDLNELRREAEDLRVRLAHLQAVIKRLEDDEWRKYMAERDRAIQSGDRFPSPPL